MVEFGISRPHHLTKTKMQIRPKAGITKNAFQAASKELLNFGDSFLESGGISKNIELSTKPNACTELFSQWSEKLEGFFLKFAEEGSIILKALMSDEFRKFEGSSMEVLETNNHNCRILMCQLDRLHQWLGVPLAKKINEGAPVSFNTVNGQVKILGEVVGNINPATQEYHFFRVLCENYNVPVSHETIAKYILSQSGKKTSGKGFPSLCLNCKSEIKKKYGKKISNLIQSVKDQNAQNSYLLRIK
jgi:hypothetical protein